MKIILNPNGIKILSCVPNYFLVSFTHVNITSKTQVINASTSTLKNTECTQMTWPCNLCIYVSQCNREILHKHYHQSSFSEENEYSMSVCLVLYHSLATNGLWAKLQKKEIIIFILESSQNRGFLFCGTYHTVGTYK